MTLQWTRTYPTKPGRYAYKVIESDEPEVIHVYQGKDYAGRYRYGWSNTVLLLAKRMHDPQAVSADELGGFYHCEQGTKEPVPLELEPRPAPPAKKKKAAKRTKAKATPQEEESPQYPLPAYGAYRHDNGSCPRR